DPHFALAGGPRAREDVPRGRGLPPGGSRPREGNRPMRPTHTRTGAFLLPALFTLAAPAPAQAGAPPAPRPLALAPAQASALARLALRGVQKEYPNKPGHVLNDAADVKGPRALHPAFYGCFDWHSAVHGHWMLVRLLRRFP